MLTMATAILSLPLFAGAPADSAARLSALPFIWDQQRTIERQPSVRLWFRGDNLFRRGDAADVYFRTDDDAYVMIVRVDTDGRLDILSPTHRDDDQLARGGRTYHVPGYSRGSFHVSDDPGMGYVFAVASWEPFDLERVGYGRSGAYRYAGQRIHGDPFTAVQDLADDLLDDRYGYYAMDHVAYYVDRRYEYPRYLCYDCHGYRSYAHWNPYAYRCVNFRMVIYNDPFYYPYRYSRGSRVIYVRDPRRPRYEFKDAVRVASTPEPYINYRFRGDDVDRRRPGSPANGATVPRRASSSSAGATRPGDDVPAGGGVGGRRVIGAGDAPSPGPDGRVPRRDGDGPIPEGRSPRREIGDDRTPPSDGEREPRRMPEREPSSRIEAPPSPETRAPRRDDGGRVPAEPRRESERQTEPRRDPERRAEPQRAAEPRREPERRAEPQRVAEPRREPERRAEPQRVAEPRREPERRSEPQRQPERRIEPRREPERRAEPSRQPERRSEPRQSSEVRRQPQPSRAEPKPAAGTSSRPTTQRRRP